MKKIISMFVVAAVLAFAGTAFAGGGLAGIGEPMHSRSGGFNNGRVSADGKTNVYCYDDVTYAEILFGVKAGSSLTQSGSDVVAYRVGTSPIMRTSAVLTDDTSADVQIPRVELKPIGTGADTTVTVGVATGSGTAFDGPTKTLTITPVKVEIAPLGTFLIKAGDTRELPIALTDRDLAPTFSEPFTVGAVSPAAGAPTVTADAKKITIDAASARAGTYEVEIKTGGSPADRRPNILRVEEAYGAAEIAINDFPGDPFSLGKLKIIVDESLPGYVADAEADPVNPLLPPTISRTADQTALKMLDRSRIAHDDAGRVLNEYAINVMDRMSFTQEIYDPSDLFSLPTVRANIGQRTANGQSSSASAATIASTGFNGSAAGQPRSAATIRFTDFSGSTFVYSESPASGDVSGRVVSADRLNIIKILASDDARHLTRAGSVAGKTLEQLDGTFNVYLDGKMVDSVDSSIDGYELRVYIADDGELDLDNTEKGTVVDPLVIVKTTGEDGGGSSSGGACDAGAAAMVGLAALAVIKRRTRQNRP